MAPLHLIVDTREQAAWYFPPEIAVLNRAKLDAGDYAIAGDDGFAIERKSLDDFLGTISTGWDRFLRELSRMEKARHVARCIVVEGTIEEIATGAHNHKKLTPGFVLKRLGRLTLEGVSVILAGSHDLAAAVAYGILRERQKDLEELYGSGNGKNQGNGGADKAGAGVGVPEAGLEMDNPECPAGLRGKMRRQGDSGVRAETRRHAGVGRDMGEKQVPGDARKG